MKKNSTKVINILKAAVGTAKGATPIGITAATARECIRLLKQIDQRDEQKQVRYKK